MYVSAIVSKRHQLVVPSVEFTATTTEQNRSEYESLLQEQIDREVLKFDLDFSEICVNIRGLKISKKKTEKGNIHG